MAHKYSFIILGGSRTAVRQIHLSHTMFFGLIALVILGLFILGFGVYDYFSLQKSLSQRQNLEGQLAYQSEEVLHQRQQIQIFAEEINQLKEHLLRLNEFEEHIRGIASLDQSEDHDSIFGVGGAAPEDLNTDIELTQKHHSLIKQMHNQIYYLENATINQEKSFDSLLNSLEVQKNMLAHTPAIRPTTGWISSRFGYRRSPFTGKREFHKGLDIANHKGTPVMATADGVVSHIGKKGSLGLVIVIDHGYGFTTRYAHLDKVLEKRGKQVKRGDVIAQVGNSGRSTGPHLHYEVHLNGLPVNPIKYILN